MTKFIYGCAIYTGKDTKMILNYKIKSNKISCIEKQLNRSMIIFFMLLAILTFLSFGFSVYYLNVTEPCWYLVRQNKVDHVNMIFDALSLYTPLIPLAMYVSVGNFN
jgi:phospholipid-translocating ATPase